MSNLVKLRINTITSGIKKNRVITINAGERKAYGANRPCNREKVQFFTFKERERGKIPLSPLCFFLFIE